MRAAKGVFAGLILVLTASTLTASGPIGIYGMVEKVVFEPNDQSPDRLQVWGAFAYVDGPFGGSGAISAVKRGYLYFRLPPGDTAAKKEWMDLKAVAGTGQAVGFGNWLYIGGFGAIEPDKRSQYGIYLPSGGAGLDMRVRPESETPTSPAMYSTNAGVIKLASDGSRAEIVRLLKEALKR